MLKQIIVGLTFVPAAILAQESKVQMKDLPAAVRKTVEEQTRTAKLRGLSKEVEHGKTFYEAETTVNGNSRDLLIDVDGKLISVEEAATLTQLPEAARKAFQQSAGPSGKILSVEMVTKGSVVYYEAVIQKSGKKSEIAIHADGTPVKE